VRATLVYNPWSGDERSGIEDYLRARLGGAAARLELPSRSGARVVLQASPAELHVDDEPWKPKPPVDGAASEWPEDQVHIALGGESDAVEVLAPRT